MTKALSRADEADLVARCAEGDEASWTRLIAQYGALVRALARRMLARRTGYATDPDVDEIVADVFLALLRRDRILLHRFDPTYRFSTYLGVICRTEVLRFLRRSNRRPQEAETFDHIPDTRAGQHPLTSLEGREREAAIRTIREAIRAMPARDQLLLTYRFLDRLDYRAIARAMDLNPESVGQLLTRAKARLRDKIPHLAHWLEPVE